MLFLLTALSLAAAPDVSGVKVVRDIVYLPDAHYADNKDRLDLYLPAGKTGVPVIVWYYGGALQQGDKSEEAGTGRRFAAAGIATAVVNYRLSPGVSHPAHIKDAAASFAWVTRHIAEYGGDPNNIFVVGHSAGAYLAALLATDQRFLAAHGLSIRDIRGMVPISAFYWVEKTGVAPDRPKTVWGTEQATWIDASPAHHLRANLPPALIVYADGDEAWRRDQNVAMAAAMKSAGNARVEIVKIAGRTHMSILHKLAEAGDLAAEAVIAFVKSGVEQPARAWNLAFHLTGGFAGFDRQLRLASTGELTATDRRRGAEVTARAPAGDLAQIAALVRDITPQQSARLPDCSDCFEYAIEIERGQERIRLRLNDVNVAGSTAAPLVKILTTLLDSALAGRLSGGASVSRSGDTQNCNRVRQIRDRADAEDR